MKFTLTGLFAVFLSGFYLSAFADSGSTLRIYKESTVLEQGKTRPAEIQYQKSGTKPASVKDASAGSEVFIKDIRVVGSTSLSPAEVDKALAPYKGRYLTTAEIHEAADALMQALRGAGLFAAKVYIPPQNIVDGALTFRVIEGNLARDGISPKSSSRRVNDDVILGQLRHTLEPGSVITSGRYERAIYLNNDLPGIKGTKNILLPAEKVGEAAFQVTPEDKPLVTGDLYFDNFGSDYTGRNRGGMTLNFNSPTGHAEMLSAGGNVSNLGTVYGYLDASLLLYPNGLRGGFTLDLLEYKTDQTGNLRGSGTDATIYFHYPVIRSRLKNLYAQIQYTYTVLLDKDDLTTITDRTLNVFGLTLHGEVMDSLFGGGVTTFRIEGVVGNVDLGNYRPFEEYDKEHADTPRGLHQGDAHRHPFAASDRQFSGIPRFEWTGSLQTHGSCAINLFWRALWISRLPRQRHIRRRGLDAA